MSGEREPVPVATNGHRRPLDDEHMTTADSDEAPERQVTVNPVMGLPASPAQIAVGFGILAGLIILLLGRRRRR